MFSDLDLLVLVELHKTASRTTGYINSSAFLLLLSLNSVSGEEVAATLTLWFQPPLVVQYLTTL